MSGRGLGGTFSHSLSPSSPGIPGIVKDSLSGRRERRVETTDLQLQKPSVITSTVLRNSRTQGLTEIPRFSFGSMGRNGGTVVTDLTLSIFY